MKVSKSNLIKYVLLAGTIQAGCSNPTKGGKETSLAALAVESNNVTITDAELSGIEPLFNYASLVGTWTGKCESFDVYENKPGQYSEVVTFRIYIVKGPSNYRLQMDIINDGGSMQLIDAPLSNEEIEEKQEHAENSFFTQRTLTMVAADGSFVIKSNDTWPGDGGNEESYEQDVARFKPSGDHQSLAFSSMTSATRKGNPFPFSLSSLKCDLGKKKPK